MLSEESTAPLFVIPGSNGERTDFYHLSEYTDAGAVVLLFYPFNFSPVCTDELCEFRDSEWLTMTPEVDVFGISTDSAFSHQKFINENDLPFPLLSDSDGQVSEKYGVLSDGIEGHPLVSKRAVFVVDDTRTIRYAWETDDWLEDPDIEAVHEAIKELDSIEV